MSFEGIFVLSDLMDVEESNTSGRPETDRFKSFAYEDLLKRDKVSLDIFWPRDESLEDSANLSDL